MWSRQPGDTAAGFYQRRFARIYPAYIVAIAAGLLVTIHLGGAYGPQYLLPVVFMLQTWIPDPDAYFAINGVSWSLGCEAFFYLCFPLYAARLLELSSARRRQLIAALVLVTLILDSLAGIVDSQVFGAIVVHAPVVRMTEFAVGALLAAELINGTWPKLPWRAVAVAALALSVFLAWLLHVAVERPFERRWRGTSRREPPVTVS